MRRLGLLLVGLLIAANASGAPEGGSLPFFDSKDLTPIFQGAPGFEQLVPARVTDLRLVNQRNQPVTEASLAGHPSLVNFFFTSCGYTCPMMMSKIQGLLPELSSFHGVHVYSLSVTPETDTPAVLRRYAQGRKMDLSHWELLTGPKKAIFALGNDVFRANRQIGVKDDSAFIHTENIYLLDQERRIRGIYKALDKDSIKLLVRDLAALAAHP